MPAQITNHDQGIAFIRDDLKNFTNALASYYQHIGQYNSVLISTNNGSDTSTPTMLTDADFLGVKSVKPITKNDFFNTLNAMTQVTNLLGANGNALLNLIEAVASPGN